MCVYIYIYFKLFLFWLNSSPQNLSSLLGIQFDTCVVFTLSKIIDTKTSSSDNVSSEEPDEDTNKRGGGGWKSDRSRVENIPTKELLSTVDFRPRDNSSSHNAEELKERWNFRRKADCQPFLPDLSYVKRNDISPLHFHSVRSFLWFLRVRRLSCSTF